MELYWTIVVGLFAAAWAIISFFRDQMRQAVADNREIMNRLVAADQLSIEHPEIHKYLSDTALQNEDYFRDEARLEDELFFKAKSYLYSKLNLFDEILSEAVHSTGKFAFFRTPQASDIAAWKTYMKCTMTHPLCRSIMKNEEAIFGGNLQEFWRKHKEEISLQTPDRFSW